MYDLVIKNGMIADGTGNVPYTAAVYVKDDRIAAISQDDSLPAKEVFDAQGLWVSPGFIDIHTHSDSRPWGAPSFAGNLAQGVTFHLAGNCGYSAVPNLANHPDSPPEKRRKLHSAYDMKSYASEIASQGIGINFATLIGHGALRDYCLENPDTAAPTEAEVATMCTTLDEMLRDGAMGLSLGLAYIPGMNAATEEVIELAKVVKKHDGIVAVHMRDEGDEVFAALEEMARVARETGVHVEISHFKLMYRTQWGKADELIARWQALRDEGLNITCDQYPYCTTGTALKNMMPPWAKKGKNRDLTERLQDDETFEKMRPFLEENFRKQGGSDCVAVANTFGVYPQLDAKSMTYVAEYFGLPVVDAYRKLQIDTGSRAKGLFHVIGEEDMLKILSRTDVAVGSDGSGFGLGKEAQVGKPHPRSAGTFPRALRLCREHKLMPMEKMVHKMTGLTASILQLKDRGLLQEGYFADITVFDPETVTDRATFEDPSLLAEGVKYVFVNGKLAFADGEATSVRAGRMILREGV